MGFDLIQRLHQMAWHWRERNKNLSHHLAPTILHKNYLYFGHVDYLLHPLRRPTHAYDLNRYVNAVAWTRGVCLCLCLCVGAIFHHSHTHRTSSKKNDFIWYIRCVCGQRYTVCTKRDDKQLQLIFVFIYFNSPSACLVNKTNERTQPTFKRTKATSWTRKRGEIGPNCK